jgi:catechol O-methyltransferase
MSQAKPVLKSSGPVPSFSDLKNNPLALAGIAAGAAGALALGYYGFIKLIRKGWLGPVGHPSFTEERLLRQVYARAAEGNADSVLAVIDDFCWKSSWMMNVGDRKGRILSQEVINKKAKVAIELGAYCGYSAVTIAKSLPADGHLYSIEFDPLHAAIATKIVEFAGLKDKVTILVGTLESKWKEIQNKFKVQTADLIFLDHVKHAYLSDFKLFESSGLIKSGTVIVADNVIFPGAPDYLEYVRGNRNYKSQFHEAQLEYSQTMKDGVEVSIRL